MTATMTRAQRLTAYLFDAQPNLSLTKRDDMVTELLKIADDRELMLVGDLAGLIHRPVPTVCSWINRGQHDVPASIYPKRRGHPMLFDAD